MPRKPNATPNGRHVAAPITNGHPLPKRKIGRPLGSGKFNATHAQKILAQLREGVPLKRICDQPGMPSRGLVLGWAMGDENPPDPLFPDKFAQARKLCCWAWADDIVTMSDESRGEDMAGVASAKLSVDSRKWMLARLAADQFGDRLQLNQTGGHVQVHITLPALEGQSGPLIEGTAHEVEDDKPDMQTDDNA